MTEENADIPPELPRTTPIVPGKKREPAKKKYLDGVT